MFVIELTYKADLAEIDAHMAAHVKVLKKHSASGSKEVALDDLADKYLPENVKMPERSGKFITLLDLSTHSSGLPHLPSNLKPKDPRNTYADYSVDDLYEFLSGYTLPRDPGAEFEYSNLGGGLLGHVLARRAETDYESLIRSRITRPLGMLDTGIALSSSMKLRMATGHNSMLAPVANWDLPTLAGAGALRSSANDMLTFLEAFLGYKESPLAPSMKAMFEVRRPVAKIGIGLGWTISSAHDREIAGHDGGTGGFRSWVGCDPKERIGVVVLSNASTLTVSLTSVFISWTRSGRLPIPSLQSSALRFILILTASTTTPGAMK